jgi:hypothetical protein
MEFRWPVGKKSMEDVALVLYPLATTQLVTGPLVSLNLLLLCCCCLLSSPRGHTADRRSSSSSSSYCPWERDDLAFRLQRVGNFERELGFDSSFSSSFRKLPSPSSLLASLYIIIPLYPSFTGFYSTSFLSYLHYLNEFLMYGTIW